jgi:hypothetical protein
VTRVPLGRDLRLGAWWFALGGTAGALMGMLVGGVGGRLLMLLLRATSPEFAGSLSDDGFEIGVVTHRTLQLLLTTAQIGALNGIGYVAARPFLSRRWRLPAWTLVGAAVGGSQIVHADGVDFALQPQWLAVGSFVALPAAGAAAIAWLVERWSRVPPWTRTRRTVLAGATAPLGAVGFALALPFALAALALARLEPLRNATRNHGAVGAALLLAAIAAVAGYDLARDVQAIL